MRTRIRFSIVSLLVMIISLLASCGAKYEEYDIHNVMTTNISYTNKVDLKEVFGFSKYAVIKDYKDARGFNNKLETFINLSNGNGRRNLLSESASAYTSKNAIVTIYDTQNFKDACLHVKNAFINESNVKINYELSLSDPDINYKALVISIITLPDSKKRSLKTNYDIEYDFNEPHKYYKPVIYLYSDVDMDLNIKFKNEENLLTTYPKYDNGWNISLKNNIIYDDNNSYYALFYDENNDSSYVDFSEGFYVESNNAISFLEEKLNILGFNMRERNEFIMYWLPILENNEKSLVYFEQTEMRNITCPIDINITPDSMLRICIHIKKVETKMDIKEQSLNSFERSGFTLVEWGGTIH